MSLLSIVTGSDAPVLRQKTQRVEKVTKEIKRLIRDMDETVHNAEGAGLAAPQIGKSLRICLAMINKKMTPLINPDITWKSDDMSTAEEGCLSLPGMWTEVPRANQIKLTYLDESGKQQERILKDWDARVVQHEVDHLDGVLILDY